MELFKQSVFVIMLVMTVGFCSKTVVFNQNHVGVVFNASKFIPDGRGFKGIQMNLEERLFIPLSKISSVFTRISYEVRDTEITSGGAPAAFLIASAVATFNKLHRNADEGPLELSLNLILDTYGDSTEAGQYAALRTIRAANKANHIFPGTVKQIFVEHIEFNEHTDDRELAEFGSILANVDFSKAMFEYELGASLAMHYCKDAGLPEVLRRIRHISFFWWPNVKTGMEDIPELSPKSAVAKLSDEYEECLQIIRGDYGSNVSVGVHTAWMSPFNKTDGHDHEKNLVKYWKLVNEWVVKVNATVLFSQAFDSLEEKPENLLEHSGWWKRVENPTSNNTFSKYNFVEKRILFKKISSLSPASFGARFGVFLTFGVIGVIITSIFVKWYSMDAYENLISCC